MHGQSISLEGVSKYWGDEAAISDINLNVPPGTFTVLLGPSGCGKSTTLRIIAGLELADKGRVKIADKDVSELPPSQRDIAMVFQSYALFPHLTVAENILFGLKVRKASKADQSKRLARVAETLGLQDYLSRKPSQLSGGQQQRVALGRAIIAEKPICLMDEPLSNLDAKLRNTMRTEIRDLQQTLGFSMVYVTHDQAEAITMADQVILMRKGKIEQAGTPREIYERPATAFVAGFIGTPPMNLIPVSQIKESAMSPDMQHMFNTVPSEEAFTVGVRPEHIALKHSSSGDAGGIQCEVRSVEYLGADMLVDCIVENSSLLVRAPGSAKLAVGDRVALSWTSDHMVLFDEVTGQRLDL